MKEANLLRGLIREMLGPFDAHAFSDKRQSLPNPPPPERDNSIEWYILDKLLNDVIPHGDKFSRGDADLFIGILKDGLYQDIIRPPNSTFVFRGMAVAPDKLLQMGITEVPRVGEKLEVTGDFLFVPLDAGSSSWTTEKKVASSFSEYEQNLPTGQPRQIEIVMTARTARNPHSFIDLSPFYPMMSLRGYEKEGEVMGLGKINFEKAEMRGRG